MTIRPDTAPLGDPDPSTWALIELARSARAISAFTGAGISTESGIPDYRGPGGVWERNARAIAFNTKVGFRDVGSTFFNVGTDRQTDRVLMAVVPSLATR